ncbi:alpha-tocopherol transfer protein-like isoform X2 [Photinus pyralis]|uniref:alpha-tocopherol transfer protein-like isoform X2 n=1 Tax=Photinus pyralis TaxID=7054 RepID=UPI001266FEBF|nr:alpha-tocopherol transfer protein-like isoform X2 [Photinus pyralis]
MGAKLAFFFTMSKIVVLEVVEGWRPKVLELYGRTEEAARIDVEKVKEWFRKQPHLPELPVDELIERFLITNKFHVEAVKSKLDVYFSVRTLLPEFYGHGPCGERVRSVTQTVYLVPLPKPTAAFSRIICFKLKDANVEKFDVIDTLGYLMNIIEVRLREDFCLSDIYIYDLQGTTIGHVLKISPTILKKMNYLMEKLYKISIEGIHIINAPTFIESAVAMFSKYFKEKIMSRTHQNLESLHEAVPKCYLPSDLGGTQKSLLEYQEIWKMKLIQLKPLLEHLQALRVNEELRPVKLPENEFLGINVTTLYSTSITHRSN